MLGARAAVDPWALIDSVASMTEQGVAALASGCRLEGWGPQGPEDVTVAAVRKLDAPAEGGGCVYDLVLERWEKGMPCYYVGGPHTFLAVEAETANPFHEPPVTVAVVTALRAAVAHSRRHMAAPASELPELLNRVQFGAVRAQAHQAAGAAPRSRPLRPKVPDPQFYTEGGVWCPHASLLESYLVRHFAFRLRRETATGWRLPPSAPQLDDHLAVTVLDLHLLGAVPVPTKATIGVELRLCSAGGAADVVRTVSRRLGRRRAWLVRLDEVVEFGRFPQAPSTAFLRGSVTIDGVETGRFRAAVAEQSPPGGAAEHFLFDPAGTVVGRIACEARRISMQDFQREGEQRRLWTRRHAGNLAVHLGREIGRELVTLLEAKRLSARLRTDLGG
jgi:hypothetical protein